MIAQPWHQSQSQLSSLGLSSSEDESSSSSEADNTKALDHDIFDEDGEPRRSGRVRRPTRDVASQMSQDAKLAKAKERKHTQYLYTNVGGCYLLVMILQMLRILQILQIFTCTQQQPSLRINLGACLASYFNIYAGIKRKEALPRMQLSVTDRSARTRSPADTTKHFPASPFTIWPRPLRLTSPSCCNS